MTKILLLAANPKDTSLLQLNEEIREIGREIRHAKFGNRFEFQPHVAVRLSDLSELIEGARPDIIHFSGHGSTSSEILLEDDNGNSHPVSKEALKEIFSLLKGSIRCVVLNACYAESQANAIAEHIDCVVGMLGQIDDQSAVGFAREFYRQLANGKDLRTAFRLGRAQVNQGQDLVRIVAFKANPAEIKFVQNNQWLSISIAGAIAILILVSLVTLFPRMLNGLIEPLITPTFSQASNTEKPPEETPTAIPQTITTPSWTVNVTFTPQAIITSPASAGNHIGLNQTVHGKLYYNEGNEWVFSDGPARVNIILDVGPYGNALIMLHDPNGVQREYVNAWGNSDARLMNYQIPDDGDYTIVVRNEKNNRADYTLRVEAAAKAGNIKLNQTVQGKLYYNESNEWRVKVKENVQCRQSVSHTM